MVKIGEFLNNFKCKKKITFGEKQDILVIVYSLDNVIYDKFYLTSSLVSKFCENWWPLELLLTLNQVLKEVWF